MKPNRGEEDVEASLDDSLVGAVLDGTYRVERRIAEGGMGVIYAGEHLRLGRAVAIKVLREPLAQSSEALARFKLEAEIVSRLGHPNIVQVFDVGGTPLGTPYLVMEYLEGETLLSRIARVGRISLRETERIVARLASALSATHRAGIVHRDIKPENIFLVSSHDEPDFVKLLDFGIGKVNSAGPRITAGQVALGTPEYMAPEQATLRGSVDARADQYALAAVAFSMLAGRPPFVGDDPADTLARVLRDPPPRLSSLVEGLPDNLDAVFLRALAKNPNKRFGSVAEFSRLFERSGSQTEPRRTPAFRHTPQKPDLAPKPAGPSTRPSARPSTRPSTYPGARPSYRPTANPSGRPPGTAQAELQAARAAAQHGHLDEAVDHAEALIGLAAAEGDTEALALLQSWLPALNQIFAERVGSLQQRVTLSSVATASSRPRLSDAAEQVLKLVNDEPTLGELLKRTRAPEQDALRMIAGLMRRRLLVPTS